MRTGRHVEPAVIRAVLDTNMRAPRVIASTGPLATIIDAWNRREVRIVFSSWIYVVYLAATVDVEDADDAMALYSERLIDLQVEERLPVYVLSLQPFERVVAALEQRRGRFHQPVMPPQGLSH